MIFDEPTSSLTDTETRALFRVIRQLRGQGVGIIYITHRLEEIFLIADRVSVLKDGEGQGTYRTAETNTNELVRRMVGRSLELRHKDAVAAGNPITLEVRNFSDPKNSPAALEKYLVYRQARRNCRFCRLGRRRSNRVGPFNLGSSTARQRRNLSPRQKGFYSISQRRHPGGPRIRL